MAGANILMTLMFVNWAAVATLNKPRDQIYWRKIYGKGIGSQSSPDSNQPTNFSKTFTFLVSVISRGFTQREKINI